MIRGTLLALLIGVGTGSCSAQAEEPKGRDLELASKSVDFALRFHGAVLKQQPGRNVFVSPVSAFLALSMAASGAEGRTREEMAAALELKGWSREEIDRGCGLLLQWLQGAEPKVTLEVANSAWLSERYPIQDAYLKRLRTHYKADANTLDFAAAGSRERIDDWANDHTNGKIRKAAPNELGASTALLLMNAVYFKGRWQDEFKKEATRPQDFTRADGTRKSLPFMHREGDYAVLDTDDFEAIRIPYGEKKRMAMVVVLPKGGTTLPRLHELLAAQWRGLKGQLVSGDVALALPRFRLEWGMDISPALKSMGMPTAFSDHADFSGMSPKGQELGISSVDQNTFIDVNEEGTEAAAVTVVAVEPTAEKRVRRFSVDRPFFCAIEDQTTGALLFTGSIVDP
jgi:serpin B